MNFIPLRIARKLALAVAGLGLTACAALPPAGRLGETAIDAPDTWAAQPIARAGIDWEWLSRFDDPVLIGLVEEAVRNNPDLRAAGSRIRTAAAQAQATAAERKPLLDANLNANRRKANFLGFPDFVGEPGNGSPPGLLSNISNSFGASLDLSWEIDLWGRIRAGESAALAQVQAAQQDERAARASLAAQVAKTWFALTEAIQQRALAQAALTAFQETESAVGERFAIGESDGAGTATQLRLAKSDVASARAQFAAREDEVHQTARQLEILLGRYPMNAVTRAATLPKLPPRPPAGLPSELLLRRPDILAAERRFAGQGKRVEEAKRAVFPQLSLTAGAGTSSESLHDLVDSDFGVWSLASNVLQPILTGGQIRAQMDIRSEEEQQALAELQTTVLQAFLEVENALDAEQFLARREDALDEAAELATEAYRSAQENYRAGVENILTVFSAESRALEFQSQLITLRRLRLDNRINLHLALGGDFRPVTPSTPS